MTRIADSQNAVALPLDELYAPIASDLEQVEQILRDQMRSRHAYVDQLVRYGCLLGGKRLRPALLLLSARCVGEVTDHHLTLAAVIEMIHTATLVHDDVLDEADVRRHLATVNTRWDNEASLLLGDFLFSHAFFLASTTGSTYACQVIGQSTNTVCEGELRQKGSRADFSLTEDEYFGILDAKTAELCACSCRLGAFFAEGSSQDVERLARYGRLLGIAFQIADDLLDVAGDEAAAGKSLGTDLAQQKPTLPLIRTLELADDEQRRQILSMLSGGTNGHAGALRRWFEQFDVLTYTRDKAREFAERALDELNGLRGSPAVHSLRKLAEFAVERSH